MVLIIVEVQGMSEVLAEASIAKHFKLVDKLQEEEAARYNITAASISCLEQSTPYLSESAYRYALLNKSHPSALTTSAVRISCISTGCI